jgi:hypothetical protein
MNKGWSMDKIWNHRAIKDIIRVRYSMFGNNIKSFSGDFISEKDEDFGISKKFVF